MQADELSSYFDLIWVPNSGYCNSTSNQMGYAPVYWYNQLSSFGTEAQLRSMIATYKAKGTGIIEDVVINHRNGVSSWTDFPAETYNGKMWQLTAADICSDDECTRNGYTATGAKDSGEGWDGMRDLDHSSANVQANVISYLNFLKNDLGYAGFRYDFVKGYAPSYTALYNSTVAPAFSVGEYWDSNLSLITNWLDNTQAGGNIQSAAFDFPLKYNLNTCCNAGTNWNKLAAASLASDNHYKRYSVTFVDNHDTYRDANKLSANALAANAFLLSTPGTPCIFLPHWQLYKQDIKQLINARKLVGITNQSTLTTLDAAHAAYYAASVSGTGNNSLLIAMGSGYAAPATYAKVLGGTNYAVYIRRSINAPWVSLPSGTYDGEQTLILSALTDDASARLIYTTDGSEPTATNGTVTSDGQLLDIRTTTTLKIGLLVGSEVKNIATRTYHITQFQPHSATIYVRADWPATYFYAWDTQGTLLGAWPGQVLTDQKTIDRQTWFCHSFPINASDYKFNLVISQGSNAAQTIDINNLTSDRYFVLSASPDASGKYTVEDVTALHTGINTPTTSSASLTVYSVDGKRWHTFPARTSVGTALRQLGKGSYIVNGKKIIQ